MFQQACNPKYHDFDKTGSICTAENINDTLTQYRWLVSAPSGADGVTSPMREVDTNTFFTNTKSITLDSIYFQAGSRVQCAARAFNINGDAGLELSSPIAVVSREEGEKRESTPFGERSLKFSVMLVVVVVVVVLECQNTKTFKCTHVENVVY